MLFAAVFLCLRSRQPAETDGVGRTGGMRPVQDEGETGSLSLRDYDRVEQVEDKDYLKLSNSVRCRPDRVRSRAV